MLLGYMICLAHKITDRLSESAISRLTEYRTALTAATFANPERAAWIASKIKLGRVGEVEDIMGAVAFLASDAAALVTGTSLIVDGGWTAD